MGGRSTGLWEGQEYEGTGRGGENRTGTWRGRGGFNPSCPSALPGSLEQLSKASCPSSALSSSLAPPHCAPPAPAVCLLLLFLRLHLLGSRSHLSLTFTLTNRLHLTLPVFNDIITSQKLPEHSSLVISHAVPNCQL